MDKISEMAIKVIDIIEEFGSDITSDLIGLELIKLGTDLVLSTGEKDIKSMNQILSSVQRGISTYQCDGHTRDGPIRYR